MEDDMIVGVEGLEGWTTGESIDGGGQYWTFTDSNWRCIVQVNKELCPTLDEAKAFIIPRILEKLGISKIT